jgi:hypothetical protein
MYRVRRFLASILCADVLAQVEQERQNLAWQRELVQKTKDSLDVRALVRAQLALFHPDEFRLDTEEVPSFMAFVELRRGEAFDEEQMLAEVHELANNQTFNLLLAYLVREQLLHTGRHASGEAELLINRGTINCVDLIKKEVEVYDGLYRARQSEPPAYDKTAIV